MNYHRPVRSSHPDPALVSQHYPDTYDVTSRENNHRVARPEGLLAGTPLPGWGCLALVSTFLDFLEELLLSSETTQNHPRIAAMHTTSKSLWPFKNQGVSLQESSRLTDTLLCYSPANNPRKALGPS